MESVRVCLTVNRVIPRSCLKKTTRKPLALIVTARNSDGLSAKNHGNHTNTLPVASSSSSKSSPLLTVSSLASTLGADSSSPRTGQTVVIELL